MVSINVYRFIFATATQRKNPKKLNLTTAESHIDVIDFSSFETVKVKVWKDLSYFLGN
jgi:hypothetical protein